MLVYFSFIAALLIISTLYGRKSSSCLANLASFLFFCLRYETGVFWSVCKGILNFSVKTIPVRAFYFRASSALMRRVRGLRHPAACLSPCEWDTNMIQGSEMTCLRKNACRMARCEQRVLKPMRTRKLGTALDMIGIDLTCPKQPHIEE